MINVIYDTLDTVDINMFVMSDAGAALKHCTRAREYIKCKPIIDKEVVTHHCLRDSLLEYHRVSETTAGRSSTSLCRCTGIITNTTANIHAIAWIVVKVANYYY